MSKPIKRNKPAIGITLDADVMKWLKDESKKVRQKPAQFVNSILAMAMGRLCAGKRDSITECAARPCSGSNAHGRLLPDSGCVASPANPAHAAARTAEARAGSTGRSKSKAG
jgi:hypothetical protein